MVVGNWQCTVLAKKYHIVPQFDGFEWDELCVYLSPNKLLDCVTLKRPWGLPVTIMICNYLYHEIDMPHCMPQTINIPKPWFQVRQEWVKRWMVSNSIAYLTTSRVLSLRGLIKFCFQMFLYVFVTEMSQKNTDHY